MRLSVNQMISVFSTVKKGYNDKYSSMYKSQKSRLYEKLSTNRWLAILTFVPALALFAFVTFLPLVWAIAGSFHEISAFSPAWAYTGTSNYVEILTDSGFRESLWKGTVFAVGSTAVQLVAGISFALLLNKTRSFRYGRLITAIAFLPYLIPTAFVSLMFLWVANTQFGVLQQVLIDLRLIQEPISFFGDASLAMPSVIAASSWKFSVFVAIMVLARLQSIPDDFYESAQMAGASAYQQFRDITLPNLQGVIFIVLLLRGVWMFNKFDIIFVLTGGGPARATETAPLYIYRVGFGEANLGLALAGATVLFLILAFSAVIYFYVFEPSQDVRVE